MGDLGDLGNFMKEGCLADLSWLDVDEAEYRAHDVLPKQNLDIVPDLEALWAHEDKPSTTYLEPNTAAKPRTMGDLSQIHGPLRASPEDIVRTARFIMMATSDPNRIASSLRGAYDTDSLRAAKTALASVLAERGLLGTYYIDAEDFPRCNKGGSKDATFVKRYASQALFVKAKLACADCTQCQHHGGQDTCATFDKQIQVQVPFTPALAEKVEQIQQAKGKVIQASSEDPRLRIQAAYLAYDRTDERLVQIKPKDSVARLLRPVREPVAFQMPEDLTPLRKLASEAVTKSFQAGKLSVPTAQQLYKHVASYNNAPALNKIIEFVGGVVPAPVPVYAGAGERTPTPADPNAEAKLAALEAAKPAEAAKVRAAMAARRAAPVVSLLRREMLKGRGPNELVLALKLAFTTTDLTATKAHWVPLFQKAGQFGVVYSTQDSFDDCHEGADFLARHNPGVRVMVAGAKCSGCIYNKISRCLLYGKPLVQAADEVLTDAMVDVVITEHRAAGRLHPHTAFPPDNPAAILRIIHTAVENYRTANRQTSERQNVQTAFHGIQSEHATSSIIRQNIVQATRRYMNEGLYGRDLGMALRSQFDPRDIKAAQADMRPVLAEQGLQGIFYVDPGIYADYGKGCEEAARLHRARVIKYAKVGPKCGSCVHHTKPGWCSKLAKSLVVEPPYENKQAQRKAILASGEATEVRFADLVNNGTSVVQEFEMGQRGMVVDVDAPKQAAEMSIELNGQGVKL